MNYREYYEKRADILKNARQQAKLSQIDVAKRAGVTQATISTYESFYCYKFELDTLEKICLALGFTLHDLFRKLSGEQERISA